MHRLEWSVNGQRRMASLDRLVVASWTGRDAAQVERNIARLEVLGIPRPRSVPSFYRISAALLTTDDLVDVIGTDASGEVEFVLVSLPEGLCIGVGSDHTDRKVEAYSAVAAKQMCPKPVSRQLWPLDEVRGHWDRLVLRSWVTHGGQRALYQEGSVAAMLAPHDLVGRLQHGDPALAAGAAMFCGTLPVIGAIRGGDRFEIELHDPVRGRSLHHAYGVRHLSQPA